MPFIPHTPESLLARSDSKNPAETCRGLTVNGRPCRRAISSPSRSPSPGAEDFCWQHKDQIIHASPQRTQATTIRERTSVDTLVDRLGLLEVGQRTQHRKSVREPERENAGSRPSRRPKQKRANRTNNPSLLCCFEEVDERRAPRPVQPQKHTTALKSRIPDGPLQRPRLTRDPSSGELLSLIPPSVSPQVASLLLAELAKSVSGSDDEGFIYMFWLTPELLPSTPPSEIAPSLLAPPQHGRRTSDVLNSFAYANSNKTTILLKIGRAQNVQRRLNQWTRQCGYNLSLIRYYPYHPSSSSASVNVPATPRKVPNVHKVERLIHIELSGKRAQGSGRCGTCGKEHREWFEVEARREGIKAVDEVVRRWVDWGERQR